MPHPAAIDVLVVLRRAIGTGNDFSFNFLRSGGAGNPFLQLMADEKVLEIIRVMIGDWLRLDHAYGIQMENDASGRGWGGQPGLHGGPRTDQGCVPPAASAPPQR